MGKRSVRLAAFAVSLMTVMVTALPGVFAAAPSGMKASAGGYGRTALTEPAQAGPSIALSAPESVSGRYGTSFKVGVYGVSWPEGSFRLLDGLITIPNAGSLELTSVEEGGRLTGGSVTAHQDGASLRFVYTNTALEDISLAGDDYPALLFNLVFTVRNVSDYPTLVFRADQVTLKRTFGEPETVFGVSDAWAVIRVTHEAFPASARELFTGDGTDLIPAGMRCWAVSVPGFDPVSLSYKGTELFYSDEFTSIHGISTFILFTDASEPAWNLDNPDNYAWSDTGKPKPAGIGDADANGVINAQDALDVISSWMRALPAPNDAGILSMNVTGDAAVDTFDAISIMEFFISGTAFPVLKK